LGSLNVPLNCPGIGRKRKIGRSAERADNKAKISSVFFGEKAFERYIYRQFKGTFKLPIPLAIMVYRQAQCTDTQRFTQVDSGGLNEGCCES
jgi:hypothetical protein